MFAAAHLVNQLVIFAGDATPEVLFSGFRILEPYTEKEKCHQEVSTEQKRPKRRGKRLPTDVSAQLPVATSKQAKGKDCRQVKAIRPQAKLTSGNQKKRSHWKNHKTFGEHGAPCSILTKVGISVALPHIAVDPCSQERTLPAVGQGHTSTMPPEMLKTPQAGSLGQKTEGGDQTLEELMSKKSKSKPRFELRMDAIEFSIVRGRPQWQKR
ncbi:hypothetical protein K438DRAFT_1783615 [Mycena galopus ATCC 62051]|nr:hypothetical protein K438DRAFT_1783615 [Mycena galopus ATCC 62051]